MYKISMKGGTASSWQSLCTGCAWGHIVSGYLDTEMVVTCRFVNPNIAIPFKVRECSSFHDRGRPTWEQMEDLAIDVMPLNSAKLVGFRQFDPGEPKEEPELEPASK